MAVLKLMLDGSLETLRMFFIALFFSIPIGLIISGMRMNKHWILNVPARLFILIMRGTPLMLQIMFFYFGPPFILGVSLDRRIVAVMALILNYSAYLAEIFRGGIEGIPLGQREAGKVLGMTRLQTFFLIVLPQVIKRILPPMSNEVINLVKDTSLIHVIGISELMLTTKQQASRLTNITPYIVAGLIYLCINAVVTKFFSVCEKKLDYYR